MTDGLITVVGRIGQEPERRTTSRGDVVQFSVARNERVRQPDGSWAQGETTWFQVNAWDRLGANAAASLHKGQPVVVHGLMQTRQWEGQDGQSRTSTTLQARAIGHDLSHGTASFARIATTPAASVPLPAADQQPDAPRTAQQGDPSAPAEPREPAPAGWSTTFAAEDETPF